MYEVDTRPRGIYDAPVADSTKVALRLTEGVGIVCSAATVCSAILIEKRPYIV